MVSNAGKKTVRLAEVGGPLYAATQTLASENNRAPHLEVGDFAKAIGFNLYAAPYPQYLFVPEEIDRGGSDRWRKYLFGEATKYCLPLRAG